MFRQTMTQEAMEYTCARNVSRVENENGVKETDTRASGTEKMRQFILNAPPQINRKLQGLCLAFVVTLLSFILTNADKVYAQRPSCDRRSHGARFSPQYPIPTTKDGCVICHDFVNGSFNGGDGKNLKWIRNEIEYAGIKHTVVYTQCSSESGDGTLADGDDGKLDGPCEVCHTQTKYHTNTGDKREHNDGARCTNCHPHFSPSPVQDMYFKPFPMIGPETHNTHLLASKGPQIASNKPSCAYCHEAATGCDQPTNGKPHFNDGKDKDGTAICDDCHSKGGKYDGVNDPVIGAKTNWESGVYTPDSDALKSGLEKWCYGCHDDAPSEVNINGTTYTAPNIIGDGVTYGFETSAHKIGNILYPAGLQCTNCHNPVTQHIPGKRQPAGFEDLKIPAGATQGQTESFCLGCHKGASVAPAKQPITNYSYSRQASGDKRLTCPDTILGAFSFIDNNGDSVSQCDSVNGSSHNLNDIKRLIENKFEFGQDANPCTACHNPHFATNDNHEKNAQRGAPVALPSSRKGNWKPFGDDSSERMSTHAVYQAPRNITGIGFEPDGSGTTDGSNLTDYTRFCSECHNSTTVIYSTTLKRELRSFDWSADRHGGAAAKDDLAILDETGKTRIPVTEMNAPYKDATLGQYYLNCTDCHEPHGSRNVFLLREKVNGGNVSVSGKTPQEWISLCSRCHDLSAGIHDLHSSSPAFDFESGKTGKTESKGIGCTPGCHSGHLGAMSGMSIGIVNQCTTCHSHGEHTVAGVTNFDQQLF